MNESTPAGEYDAREIDSALDELRLKAGIAVPGHVQEGAQTDLRPVSANQHVLSDISFELRFLADLYFRGKVTFDEVKAPDRKATIDRIRREGRV